LEEKPVKYIIDYVDELERNPYEFMERGVEGEFVPLLLTHYGEHLKKAETFRSQDVGKIQLHISELLKQKQTPKCLQYYQDSQREVVALGTARAAVVLFLLRCPTPFTPQ
jgi:hypothetical protein